MTHAKDAPDLYSLWRRIGVNCTGPASPTSVDLEQLILDTAAQASADERLTVLAASWLAQYHDFVDGRRLSELACAANARTRAYLGALLTFARDAPDGARHAPEFDSTLLHCQPLQPAKAFYDIVQRSADHERWMKERALPLYLAWGLWHDDAQLQRRSLLNLEHVQKVPELKARHP